MKQEHKDIAEIMKVEIDYLNDRIKIAEANGTDCEQRKAQKFEVELLSKRLADHYEREDLETSNFKGETDFNRKEFLKECGCGE